MAKHESKSEGLRARKGKLFLSAVTAVCVTGLIYLACISPQQLRATPEPNESPATSIRLGLPAFAFESQGGQSEVNATSASDQQSVLRPSVSTPFNANSGGIQIRPKGTRQVSGMIISPRRSDASPTHARASQPSQFYQASQQSDKKDEPAKADEFWKSVVNGQATRLNDPKEASSKGGTQPPTQDGQAPQLNAPPSPTEQNAIPGQGKNADGSLSPRPVPQNSVPAVPLQLDGRPSLTPQQSPQQITPAPSTTSPPTAIIDNGQAGPVTGHTPIQLPPAGHAPLGAHSIPSIQSSPVVTSGHSFGQTQPGMSGYRATVEKDATDWISPYAVRADQTIVEMSDDMVPALDAMPVEFRPWWDAIVRQAVNPRAATMQVNVSNLIQDALLYSPQVVAIQAEPEVKYRIITQEAARFDWTAFLESTYNDLNDPVGNELTTGNGQDRLLTRQWQFSSGVRRKNSIGGEVQVTQDFGHENQNSRFFIPNNQASSRLELSYRQPLLDGAGRAFNQSEIVLARIEANSSEDEVVDALQDHLIQVTTAYWTLYRSRSEFFQRQKLLISSQDVLNRLRGRAAVDTIPRQILRAQAAVARAKTGIRRTLARVQDAEAQLRLLVNSPGMLNGGPTELLPFEPPVNTTESADLRSILQTALFNRADISAAIRQMRAAGVRLGVSQQELLPRLDVLVSTYVADLSGGSDLGTAIRGKYLDNRPGYTVGLEFEMPLGNRAARARNEQRQWELKRAVNVFRATVEKSLTDVEIGRREVETSHAEMTSRYHSMSAANQESNYLRDRFQVFPEAEDSATLLLEDLLDSFERLADEESAFVRAQVDHALSLIDLKKQMGTLLRSRHDRPEIDTAHQQWVQNRLKTHAPGDPNDQQQSLAGSEPTPRTNNSSAKTTQSSGRKDSEKSSSAPLSAKKITQLRAEAQSKDRVQPISHQRYQDLYVPRGEPIPAHQTTWKRSPLNQ